MTARIACIGGAHVDRTLRASAPVMMRSSNPVETNETIGGVACNVARVAARLGAEVAFLGLVGDDEAGRKVRAALDAEGVDTGKLAICDAATATYTAVLDRDGNLVVGLADMPIYERITAAHVMAEREWLSAYPVWFGDANMPRETLRYLGFQCRRHHQENPKMGQDHHFVTSAVSESKMRNVVGVWAAVHFGNAQEISSHFYDLEYLDRANRYLLTDEAYVATFGAAGCLAVNDFFEIGVPAAPAVVRDVTGAGDALVGAFLAQLEPDTDLYNRAVFDPLLRRAVVAAAFAVEEDGGVPVRLTREDWRSRIEGLRTSPWWTQEEDVASHYARIFPPDTR